MTTRVLVHLVVALAGMVCTAPSDAVTIRSGSATSKAIAGFGYGTQSEKLKARSVSGVEMTSSPKATAARN
jgi:hypothetical protein